MNSKKLTISEDISNHNCNQTFFPNMKYRKNILDSPRNDIEQNNNKSLNIKPQASQSNQEKASNAQNNNLTENNSTPREHPLVFYALGKVSGVKEKNLGIPLYTSQGFRSNSNDLLKRNMHSIHTSYYDELKKKKEYGLINNQIIDENNYLQPIKVFKSFHKYDVKDSCINQETYNITKKKLFSRDRYSNIKKGLNITKKQFIEEKNKFLKEKVSRSIEVKDNKNNKLLDSFDNNYNNTTLDNNKNQLYKTINTDINCSKSIFKDPNDYTIEELKSNDWRFDRNFTKFIKHKNWWKSDKYVIIYKYILIYILI